MSAAMPKFCAITAPRVNSSIRSDVIARESDPFLLYPVATPVSASKPSYKSLE